MKKLKLDLEKLKVESFDTTLIQIDRRGTAKGFQTALAPTCESCPASDCGTCPNTCGVTCNCQTDYGPTCVTCNCPTNKGYTCYDSCNGSCDVTCPGGPCTQ